MDLYKMALEEASECEARARGRGRELNEARGRMRELEQQLGRMKVAPVVEEVEEEVEEVEEEIVVKSGAGIKVVAQLPATPKALLKESRGSMIGRLRATREGKATPLGVKEAGKENKKAGAGVTGLGGGFLKAKSPLLQSAFMASKQRKLFRKVGGDNLAGDMLAE